MADDRYLEGDPRADEGRFLFTDLSDFVAVTAQECQLIADLIAAGRTDDARAHAVIRTQRAKAILRDLEKPTLPEVDVDKTPDTISRAKWQYKARPLE